MRKYILFTVGFVVLFGLFLGPIAGCSPKGQTYGQSVTESNVTGIGAILAKPDSFAGKTVRIEGEITEVCPSGCWFRIKDATGVMYVNLYPSAFVIPQVRGRRAAVQGTVKKEHTNISVVGTGVRLK